MHATTLADTRPARAGGAVALAQATFPETIALPNGFAPEGIEIKGDTVYVGSVGSGAIWAGDLRTGHGDVIVPGAPGTRSATGIEYDHGLLWVSGARFGNALVYDAKTGVLLQELQLATGTAATFINDAVVTQRGVYFTDSQRPVHLQGGAHRAPRRPGDDDPAGR